MRSLWITFVTAVCFLFLLTLKWPKNKNIYKTLTWFSGGDTNSKADKPVALIYESNWNLECWFLWSEENRRTRTKTLGAGTRTNNKLNPLVTLGPGIEPGPRRWEADALTTTPSRYPQISLILKENVSPELKWVCKRLWHICGCWAQQRNMAGLSAVQLWLWCLPDSPVSKARPNARNNSAKCDATLLTGSC